MSFWPYIAIFVNFQEINYLTKMKNTETCDLTPFIEYIVPFLPLYCDFLIFQEKNSLTKLENIENCMLSPFVEHIMSFMA